MLLTANARSVCGGHRINDKYEEQRCITHLAVSCREDGPALATDIIAVLSIAIAIPIPGQN